MELSVFKNEQFQVSAILDKGGKVWFPATDTALYLGYTNPTKAVRDHCLAKGRTARSLLTKGGAQQVNFIDEGNLYRLIMRSRMPDAADFQAWVCDEVLPAIRKTGQYTVPTTEASSDPFAIMQLMLDQVRQNHLRLVQAETAISETESALAEVALESSLTPAHRGLLDNAIAQRITQLGGDVKNAGRMKARIKAVFLPNLNKNECKYYQIAAKDLEAAIELVKRFNPPAWS